MTVSVEGCRPYCWSCGSLRHMAEAGPGKNAAARLSQAAADAAVDSGEWKAVGRKSERRQPLPYLQ